MPSTRTADRHPGLPVHHSLRCRQKKPSFFRKSAYRFYCPCHGSPRSASCSVRLPPCFPMRYVPNHQTGRHVHRALLYLNGHNPASSTSLSPPFFRLTIHAVAATEGSKRKPLGECSLSLSSVSSSGSSTGPHNYQQSSSSSEQPSSKLSISRSKTGLCSPVIGFKYPI